MQTRNKSLDILRAFAILLVLGRHMRPYPGTNLLLKKIVGLWLQGGWVGVDLFFVLSGFLISGLLFKEHIKSGKISFKHFFIRRILKIFPAYYFMIIVSIFILSIHFSIPAPPLFADLFFMQDYVGSLWGHTWSLGVEEKFYVLLPLVLILLSKINKSKNSPFNSIPFIFMIVCITCLGLRLLNSSHTYYYVTYLFPFHLRFDSLFCGVAISYFYHYHSSEFKTTAQHFKFFFLFTGFLFLSPAFLFSLDFTPFIYTAGLTFFYLGSGLILIAVVDNKFKDNLLSKSLAYIGSHSYSIYLWFVPVKAGLDYLFFKILPLTYLTWSNYTITYFIACISIGITMSKMIEFPVLKLRDRFYPSVSFDR